MDKKQIMNYAYWIMIIVVILTCFFVVFYLQTNATACLSDPISYYSNKTNQMCFCMENMWGLQ